MATELFISVRRFAGLAIILLLPVALCTAAAAQTAPLVTSSFATGVAAHNAFKTVWNVAVSSHGDVVVMDFESGAVYHFPADGRPEADIPLGLWGWTNPGVAIDSSNAIYLGNQWSGGMSRIPYDPVTKGWKASAINAGWAGDAVSDCCGVGWYHPTAMAVNASGLFVFGIENPSNTIFAMTVDAAGNYDKSTARQVVTGLKARPRSLAVDAAGNIYLFEDGGTSIYLIPAGTTGVTGESSFARIDPQLGVDSNGKPVYGNPQGVAVDPAGNVYISDKNNGIYLVPNESGTVNTAHTYLLTPVAAQATVGVDATSGILYVPTGGTGWRGIIDLAKVTFGTDLGNVLAGAQGSAVNVYFAFSGNVSPASIAFRQGGASSDVVKVGGNCSTTTTYQFGDTCTATVTLQPHTEGPISGELVMLDAQNTVLSSSLLQGTARAAVTGSFPVAMANHTAFQNVWNIAVSTYGDVVAMDFQGGGVYHFPANGGPEADIPLGLWGWTNPGVAIDSANALYLGNQWSGGMSRIPYDPVTKGWKASAINAGWAGDAVNDCCGVGWFHPTAMAVNSHGLFVFGIENPSNTIFAMTVDANGVYDKTTARQVATGLKGRPRTLAVDEVGNIYVLEDGGAEIYRIAAGTTGVTGESSFTRVDPGGTPTGASVDSAGNVYISDQDKGVYLVPNEGGTLNTAHTFLLLPVPARGNVALDERRATIYVPTIKTGDGGWKGINDLAKVTFGADLGTAPLGTPGSTVTAYYAFAGDVTPGSFSFVQGIPAADFTVTGGTCHAATAYVAGDNCTVTMALQPHAAGLISGKLEMLDAGKYLLASNNVHGVAQGPMAAFLRHSMGGTLGAGLTAPQQLAADARGNIYVADSALGKVLQYGASGSAEVGTGLTAPTGVAVDGLGNVFIADGGRVLKVPYLSGALDSAAQTVVVSGLGGGLKLAADAWGSIIVADPDNQRVLKILYPGQTFGFFSQRTVTFHGFTQLTAVAVDETGNLLLADGANLIRIAADGTQTTLTDQLASANGLAVDPSGAVYVSQAGGAIRIPKVGGVLSYLDKFLLAPAVTAPAGVALDGTGNLYLGHPTAQNIAVMSVHGALDFGILNLGDAPSLNADIFNIGNAPLTFTSFTSLNLLDFTVASAAVNGCDAVTPTPMAPGASCALTATMNPGPGEEGLLSGAINVASNAAMIALNVAGTGAALAPTTTSLSVDAASTHLDTVVTVTVKPVSGTGVPTGDVTVSVGSVHATGALTGGSATLHLALAPAGSPVFTASYNGDRTYRRSTATTAGKVGKIASSIALPPNIPTYVLANNSTNGIIPSTTDVPRYIYTLTVHVSAAAGSPGGTVSFMEGTSAACAGYSLQDPHNTVELDASGNANWTTDCLWVSQDRNTPHPVTPHTITAVYNGDANFLGVSSPAVNFQVLRNPSIMITPASGAISVAAGSSGSTNLTLTSVAGYGVIGRGQTAHLFDWSGPVSLQCSNLPAHATCSFNPSQVPDVTDGSPGSTVVTVNTNVPAETVAGVRNSAPVVFAAMFGFGLVGLLFGRKSKYQGRLLTMICVLLIVGGAVAGISACGTSNIAPTPKTATPAGSYTVNVTVTQSVNQNLVSIPFSFKLNVQ